LSCPGCALGSSESHKYDKDALLSPGGFKFIVDSLSDVLMGINLSLLGEPMLNPHLCEMIAYCRQKNVGTVFPTTLSVKLSEDQVEGIIKSGLDRMVVSIDGTTQEVYAKYRRGGNLNLAIRNASAIIAAKRAHRSRHPIMEFKFILFDHNRHQLEDANKLSRSMGFDKFVVVHDNGSPVLTSTLDKARSCNLTANKACFWPWSSIVIRWNGTVWPCCTSHANMGNVFETPFSVIWNSERYQRLRSFFGSHFYDEFSRACMECMHF
jgi:radical SAM protein with 4Fe4S-binding SPASM domain